METSLLADKFSNPFQDAVRFLSNSTENGGVYGLGGSAQALLIAAAVRGGPRTIVLVSPDGESASRAAIDVRFYLGEEEVVRHPLQDEVIRYPSSEVLPYSFGGT